MVLLFLCVSSSSCPLQGTRGCTRWVSMEKLLEHLVEALREAGGEWADYPGEFSFYLKEKAKTNHCFLLLVLIFSWLSSFKICLFPVNYGELNFSRLWSHSPVVSVYLLQKKCITVRAGKQTEISCLSIYYGGAVKSDGSNLQRYKQH